MKKNEKIKTAKNFCNKKWKKVLLIKFSVLHNRGLYHCCGGRVASTIAETERGGCSGHMSVLVSDWSVHGDSGGWEEEGKKR